jgi:hypothetical protein
MSKAAVISSSTSLGDVENHFLDWGRVTGKPEVMLQPDSQGLARSRLLVTNRTTDAKPVSGQFPVNASAFSEATPG